MIYDICASLSSQALPEVCGFDGGREKEIYKEYNGISREM